MLYHISHKLGNYCNYKAWLISINDHSGAGVCVIIRSPKK